MLSVGQGRVSRERVMPLGHTTTWSLTGAPFELFQNNISARGRVARFPNVTIEPFANLLTPDDITKTNVKGGKRSILKALRLGQLRGGERVPS